MASSKSLIRSESLSADRLNGKMDDDLIVCPICLNILWKPIACKTCENSFCLKCIRLWLNEKANQCPFNCYFEERKAPGILLKLLSKLKFDCSNKSNGCLTILFYESLEKHQLEECQFRFIQCQYCSKEMFFKDLENHQQDNCSTIELTCLKCSSTYSKSKGHTQLQCLKQQIQIIENKMQLSHQYPKTIQNNYQKLIQLYMKLLINENYSKRIQLLNYTQDDMVTLSAPLEETSSSPSAPFEETFSSPPPQSESSTNAATSTTETNLRRNSTPSRETLRISKIDFTKVIGLKKEGGYVPNGYAAFNWENAYYMTKDYIEGKYQLRGFSNAFNNSLECVAYNGKGNPISIFLPNSQNKFNLHSFEALAIYHDHFQLSVTGYRSNLPIYIKHIILNNKYSKLFEIDWEQIEKIILTPSPISTTVKPETFALISLNLIL